MDKKRLNLLILEDNPDDAKLDVMELEREDFIVEWTVVDTEKAFQKALKKKPDIILVDYTLPSFDGMSAIETQQKSAPDIPLIIVAGTIGEDIAVECMKRGATDYVLKDRLSRLGPVVKRALKEAEARSEYKQAEKALRQSEQKYRTLTEAVTDVIFTVDIEGKFTYLSPRFEKITNFKAKDLLGHSFTEMLAPEYRKSAVASFKKNIKGKAIFLYELEFLQKDGSRVPLEINITSLLDTDGKTIGRLGVARDITKRKEAEKLTKQSEAKLRSILNTMTDYCFIVSKDFRIEFLNKAVIEEFGDQTGKICYEAFFNEKRPCPWSKMKEVQKGKTVRWEHYSQEFKITFDIINSPLANIDGTISQLGIWRDISRSKQAETEREKLIDELKESLSKIKTLSGLLPICASCKKIKDDNGYWHQVEVYIKENSDAEFSHGLCPECTEKLYPGLIKDKK
jgi:PAS domain S-box-containing protein